MVSKHTCLSLATAVTCMMVTGSWTTGVLFVTYSYMLMQLHAHAATCPYSYMLIQLYAHTATCSHRYTSIQLYAHECKACSLKVAFTSYLLGLLCCTVLPAAKGLPELIIKTILSTPLLGRQSSNCSHLQVRHRDNQICQWRHFRRTVGQ